MAQLKITQIKSQTGSKAPQRASLRSLGLGKPRQSTVREDTPQLRGYIRHVAHLVTIEEA